MNRSSEWGWIAAIMSLVVLLDQVTKEAVRANFLEGERLAVIPGFFNLTLVFNPGAAFGIFSGLSEGTRQLAVGAAILVAVTIIILLFFREFAHVRAGRFALAFLAGGAIGNVVDRIRFGGKVLDFLDFYVAEWHWPAFNVADMAIVMAVAVLLVISGRKDQSPKQEGSGEQAAG